PGSSHVQSVGLDCAGDDQVWEHARLNGFAIVTKDEDYNNLSVVRGSPPKVIWLQLGNCATGQVEAAFRARFADLEAFEKGNRSAQNRETGAAARLPTL
ncbi:MAG TPA: DUF5615 family PIN-like protein, partial [Gemmataceae bacterium]|nr:DUF5615 family PIN-like protein [Gemmataceae bacterium]